MSSQPSRRQWLLILSSGSVASVAGCIGDDEPADDETPADDLDDEPAETTDDDPPEDETRDEEDEPDEDEHEDDATDKATFELDTTISQQPVHGTLVPHERALTPEGGLGTAEAVEWAVDGAVVGDGRAIVHEFDGDGDYDVALLAQIDDEWGVTETTVAVQGTPASPPPRVDNPNPHLVSLDGMTITDADELESPGAVLAVSKDGERLLTRGYGWRDRNRSDPMTGDSLFRIASVTKAFTRAAIQHLISNTDLELDTAVFEQLDIEPRWEVEDERIYDITVADCMDHTVGWDRTQTYDPMLHPLLLADDFGFDEPAPTEETVAAWMTRSLQFEPGTKFAYTNVGYTVLELLIEQESSQSYVDYLRETVLDGVDPEDVQAAESFPADRPDREVEYDDGNVVYRYDAIEDPDEDDLVYVADGGLNFDVLTGAAGLVMTADACLSFLDEYDLETGKPRDGAPDSIRRQDGHFLKSTAAQAIQYPNDVNVVRIFNSAGPYEMEPIEAREMVNRLRDDAVDEIDEISAGTWERALGER